MIQGMEAAQRAYDSQEPAYYSDDGGAARNAEIMEKLTSKDSEYYFLSGANLCEAISESKRDFEQKLAAAVQANDAERLLQLIKSESRTYWMQYLELIID